jgi:heme oxygenase
MTLRDLTSEKHKDAERQEFVKILLSGKIHPLFYATFLANQYHIYYSLEVLANLYDQLKGLPDIRRARQVIADYNELWTDPTVRPQLVPVVKEYSDYITALSRNDPRKLFAHIYVRHMGDLAGGQMIAKKVPGKGSMYKFEDAETLKAAIRERLTDDLAQEANICFDFAIKLFQQLMELDIPKYVEETNE